MKRHADSRANGRFDRVSVGRYDRVHEATHPGQLPKQKRGMLGKVDMALGAIPDPITIFGEKLKRQQVKINIAADPLEREYSFNRISNAAYAAGREYRDTIELARNCGGGATMEPASSIGDHGALVAKRMDRAASAVAMQNRTRAAIGQWAELILRGVLADGRTFREVAAATGRPTKARTADVVNEFREALEALAIDADRRR